MRKLIGTVCLGTALALIFSNGGYSQPGQKGKGTFGKGGGMQFGGKGGGYDPNAIFDKLSAGKPYIDLATTESRMKSIMIEYAQKNGITDGKITREQFLAVNEYMKSKFNMGRGPNNSTNTPPTKGGPTPPNTTPAPSQPQVAPIEAWNQMAEWEFKKEDENRDEVLNKNEMPRSLREDLAKWDKDGNELITLAEFKPYYIARMQERFDKDFAKWNPAANPIATIIIEDEWDKRPVVFRAGKLPKELPDWFAKLDVIVVDAQVSLAEWLKGGKEIDAFETYDRNDDGFLTVEEVLRYEITAKNTKDGKTNGSIVFNYANMGSKDEAKKKSGFGFDKGGFGDKSGFFKKKR